MPRRPKPAPPPPSPEQLALAYRTLRKAHWPDTLDAALQHPCYGPCIRGYAGAVSRSAFSTLPHGTQALPLRRPSDQARLAAEKPRARYIRAGSFDARRAAANDTDD